MDKLTIVLSSIGIVGLVGYWLNGEVGSDKLVMLLFGLSHLVAFVAGALLSTSITRGAIKLLNDYAKNDATVDRFRLQSMKEAAKSDVPYRKAEASMQIIDAKRVDRLAQDRAKLIINQERINRKEEDKNATWSWDS